MTDSKSVFYLIGTFIVAFVVGYVSCFFKYQDTAPYTLVVEATGYQKTLYMVSDKHLIPVNGDFIQLTKQPLGSVGRVGAKK